MKNSLVEELVSQFAFFTNLNHHLYFLNDHNPFYFTIIANFHCLRIGFEFYSLKSLLDSLGNDLGSSDHFYTIISLALGKSTLESS